jgi:hypothetical protein
LSGSMAARTINEMDWGTSSTWWKSGAEGLSTMKPFERKLHQDVATTRDAITEWKWR